MYASDDEDEDETFVVASRQLDMMRKVGPVLTAFGMLYAETYLNKSKYREATLAGYDWVMRNLNFPQNCYDMFRMSRPLFERLHNLLVTSYGLKSTSKMDSIEALGMFLWTIGAPQSFVQVKNRFERSKGTISVKF